MLLLEWLREIPQHPGRLYVIATLLPLASFVILLLLGALRNAFRPYRNVGGFGATLFHMFGGDRPNRVGAYVATTAIALSFACSAVGLVWFLTDHPVHSHEHTAPEHKSEAVAEQDQHDDKGHTHEHGHGHAAATWVGRSEWARVGMNTRDSGIGVKLEVGYYIDHLAAVMFAMVTFVAMLIHIFSAGYMSEELQDPVEDHQVHGADGGHYKRRGRFGRFFMYLSLFCFSMLNLVLADNLFQVFVSWELVGICSYLLIGHYYERQSASNASNKAFITNRIGDAGFIVGMLIIWSVIGTFNFQEIFAQVRAPVNSHGEADELTNQIVRVNTFDADKISERKIVEKDGAEVLLFPAPMPRGRDAHYHIPSAGSKVRVNAPETWYEENDNRIRFRTMPYILLSLAGMGIFLGCVGKSAQFPLHVWLPDAMEGPTPVSALIHAATMVAAGVYLVGRVFPLFTPEARLTIAYVGAITMFLAATIAIVMNDIKKVLAYSTVSQLGFMMLALGIGGWVAGLLHLLTHAFFKALLFLGSGSVIYGCHHEQDMRKMGGLLWKMPVTAFTMLVGVLAISGTPLFSGWYSKDAILAQALAFGTVNRTHSLLLVVPLVTAAITCFYMFRMWFLTFMGEPKDRHVHDHARESPKLMTIPLILLAICSFAVAWGMPPWDAEASYLGKILLSSEPAAVSADFGKVETLLDNPDGWVHPVAGLLALGAAVMGALFAALVYFYKVLDPAETKEQFGFLYRLFERKWYFDELYSALLVRPALVVAHWCRNADVKGIDRLIDGTVAGTIRVSKWDGQFDNGIIDGTVNVIADSTHALGTRLRRLQTGFIRNYILFLVIGTIVIFAVLSYFINLAAAGN